MPQHHDHDPFAVIADLVQVDDSESTATFIIDMVDDLCATVLRLEHRDAQLESREPAGATHCYAQLYDLIKQFEQFLSEAHLIELRDPASSWVGRDLPPTQPQAHSGDLPPTQPQDLPPTQPQDLPPTQPQDLPPTQPQDLPPTQPLSAHGRNLSPAQLQLDMAHATTAELYSLEIKA